MYNFICFLVVWSLLARSLRGLLVPCLWWSHGGLVGYWAVEALVCCSGMLVGRDWNSWDGLVNIATVSCQAYLASCCRIPSESCEGLVYTYIYIHILLLFSFIVLSHTHIYTYMHKYVRTYIHIYIHMHRILFLRSSLTGHAGTLQVGGDLASTVWILSGSLGPKNGCGLQTQCAPYITGLFQLVPTC